MANIRGDQAMPRTIATVARKKSGKMITTSQAVSDKNSPVDKKQKRTIDQWQLQNGESQDSDSPAKSKDTDLDSPIESGDPDSKTEEDLESFLVDPHHLEQVLRIGSILHPQYA